MPYLPFVYKPLQREHIRLLYLLPPGPQNKAQTSKERIECELVHIHIDSAGQYEALSYVWGPPTGDAMIFIKAGGWQPWKTTISVTHSLFTALLHLRYVSKKRYLWIDQLCINQTDTSEKNIQVGRMGDIYGKAESTVVWLGPQIDLDGDLLNEMYKTLSVLPSRPNAPGGVRMLDQGALVDVIGTTFEHENKSEIIRRRRHLLERFLDIPWFCRVWVYQEVVVAARVNMLWGHMLLPLDFVTGLIVSVYSIAKSAEDGRWHRRIKKVSGFSPVQILYHHRLAHKEGKLNLLHVMSYARKHLNATNHRDYVFGFLAINKVTSAKEPNQNIIRSLQDLIVPNYEVSVEVVYVDLARAAVRSSASLEILQYVVPTRYSDKAYKLPSWVPNWADRGFICGSPIFMPGVPIHFSACKGKWYPRASMNSNQAELPVRGHKVGCISTVLKHSFKHSYYSSTLKEAFNLDRLEALLRKNIARIAQQEPDKKMPDWFVEKTRQTLLRTALADGSFTINHKLSHSIEDLLALYDNEITRATAENADGDIKLRQYLQQTGEIASGKRMFLTDELDIGLSFSTIRAGDVVCILYGSQVPCILRKDENLQDRYNFVGVCFLDGWMNGERNPRNWEWWREGPEEFILV